MLSHRMMLLTIHNTFMGTRFGRSTHLGTCSGDLYRRCTGVTLSKIRCAFVAVMCCALQFVVSVFVVESRIPIWASEHA